MLIFFMLHGGGQAKGAAGTVLSTLENLARFHVALFSDLLACTSLTSLASLLDSRFQTLLGVYQSFLADFDRSLGWAGVLLTHAHTAEADQWAIVDAFVECIRQIEVYRWVVRMILEATPSPHAARNSLQSAARALHRVSVQAAMGEHHYSVLRQQHPPYVHNRSSWTDCCAGRDAAFDGRGLPSPCGPRPF